MALVPTSEVVARAVARRCGAGAFNVITLEHAEAIAAAAEAARAPVVLQVSHNAVRYHGNRLEPIGAACQAVARSSAADIALHLDHVEDRELLERAPAAGFSSAMYDASALSYAENVSATREATRWLHDHGLWAEAELGEVGGKRGAHVPGARTAPAEARDFVAATGVDMLAVAAGSEHAMTHRSASLDLALIRQLADVAGVPLVLHGSSGVPDGTLVRAIQAGMVKINIGTILNVAFTGTVAAQLTAGHGGVDPRRYLGAARTAMTEVVAQLLRTIGGGVMPPAVTAG